MFESSRWEKTWSTCCQSTGIVVVQEIMESNLDSFSYVLLSMARTLPVPMDLYRDHQENSLSQVHKFEGSIFID